MSLLNCLFFALGFLHYDIFPHPFVFAGFSVTLTFLFCIYTFGFTLVLSALCLLHVAFVSDLLVNDLSVLILTLCWPCFIPPLSTGWAQLWHGPPHQATPMEDHFWRSAREMCRGPHLSQVRSAPHADLFSTKTFWLILCITNYCAIFQIRLHVKWYSYVQSWLWFSTIYAVELQEQWMQANYSKLKGSLCDLYFCPLCVRSSAWRSVRLCAAVLPSWWKVSSVAWALCSTLRTG